jgi:hypothetical protein
MKPTGIHANKRLDSLFATDLHYLVTHYCLSQMLLLHLHQTTPTTVKSG